CCTAPFVDIPDFETSVAEALHGEALTPRPPLPRRGEGEKALSSPEPRAQQAAPLPLDPTPLPPASGGYRGAATERAPPVPAAQRENPSSPNPGGGEEVIPEPTPSTSATSPDKGQGVSTSPPHPLPSSPHPLIIHAPGSVRRNLMDGAERVQIAAG